MASWINRTVLSGSSVDANGTNSHTCTFTAATTGNYLVAVVAGSVTFTTPSGWTLSQSAVNSAGLYCFTKTASDGESSFTTTHNGSDYAIEGVIYEFPAGTSFLAGSNQAAMFFNSNNTGPTVSGLSGTYTRFAARTGNMDSSSSTASHAWTLPTVEDYDAYVPKGTQDGIELTIAYDDGQTGSSFTPSGTMTTTNVTSNGEGIAWALSVAPKAAPIAAYSFDATGTAGGSLSAGTSITDDSGNGNTLVTQNGASTMALVTGNTNVGVEANGLTYAHVPSTTAVKPTSAVTWMCWAKLTSSAYGWGQIFGRNNDDGSWGEAFSFYLDNEYSGDLGIIVQITTYPSTSAFSNQIRDTTTRFPALNTWTHLAASWSEAGGTMRFYMNGTHVGTFYTSGYLYYGASGNTSRYFSIFRNTEYAEVADKLQLDDVRVFDKELSATEINTWMTTPVGGGSPATTIPLNWITGVNG